MANAGVELNLPVSRGKVRYAELSGSGEGVKGALDAGKWKSMQRGYVPSFLRAITIGDAHLLLTWRASPVSRLC